MSQFFFIGRRVQNESPDAVIQKLSQHLSNPVVAADEIRATFSTVLLRLLPAVIVAGLARCGQTRESLLRCSQRVSAGFSSEDSKVNARRSALFKRTSCVEAVTWSGDESCQEIVRVCVLGTDQNLRHQCARQRWSEFLISD